MASEALTARQKVQHFLTAACVGNLDLLKNIASQLDEGSGMSNTVADIKDANKRGALHFAAREGQTEVCKYLLEELKLDVDTKDEDGTILDYPVARRKFIRTLKYPDPGLLIGYLVKVLKSAVRINPLVIGHLKEIQEKKSTIVIDTLLL
ncbi:hypothetical protein POTOM_043975 [Populus tomentosa]|uniref:Ankyrin repeat family protein n=1 Tax=Populus tomentosa TaxID=118781 RepID=A0A8X7YFB9_POPTO|nr:hypothetical protein POTOM_043975 [Populus tomentosa]